MMISTGLGAWDTIARNHVGQHGITFPLAIVHAAIVESGYPEPVCVDGPGAPKPGDVSPDVVLISALDSRMFWRFPKFLRKWKIPVWSQDRSDSDPIVIMGGQAAYAPAPVEDLVDVVFVGEAEGGISELLAILDKPFTRKMKLELIAELPFCVVRQYQDDDHVVKAVYAEDIGISLRNRLDVNLRTIHRMEIARGCKGPSSRSSDKGTAACAFCSLGHRAPYRENTADEIGKALVMAAKQGVTEVHLSAGDAEGHSAIRNLRSVVSETGVRDHGWTGRLDTAKDCSVSAGKHFAFGVEGASHRLRRIIGKPKLTNDYIVERIREYWASGGRRMMLHFIGGLPSERNEDYDELRDLFERLSFEAQSTGSERAIDVGRQPFGPLPHTPMQWFAPGLTTKGLGRVFSEYERSPNLRLYHKSGQSYGAALVAAIPMRGGRSVARMIVSGTPRLDRFAPKRRLYRDLRKFEISPDQIFGEWDPSEPTPWSHIETYWPNDGKIRKYKQMRRRLFSMS